MCLPATNANLFATANTNVLANANASALIGRASVIVDMDGSVAGAAPPASQSTALMLLPL